MCWRRPDFILLTEYPLKVFHGDKKTSNGLVNRENPLMLFYMEKTFWLSFIAGRLFHGLLLTKDSSACFNRQKTPWRSSINKRPCDGNLLTKDPLMALWQSYDSLVLTHDPLNVFNWQMTLWRSPVYRTSSTDLSSRQKTAWYRQKTLWRSFTERIHYNDLLQTSNGLLDDFLTLRRVSVVKRSSGSSFGDFCIGEFPTVFYSEVALLWNVCLLALP